LSGTKKPESGSKPVRGGKMRYKVAAMDIEVYTSGIACICVKPEDITGKIFCDRSGPMQREKIIEALAAMKRLIKRGYWIVTWNGLGFDYRILAEAAQGNDLTVVEVCRMAIQQIDIMYNFQCVAGFPASLENVSKAMGFNGKHIKDDTIGRLWHGSSVDQDQVIEYVERDVMATFEIYDAIMKRRGKIVWKNRKGTKSARYLPMIMVDNQPVRLMNAVESVTLPYPNLDWWWDDKDKPDKLENIAWFTKTMRGQHDD